MNKRLVYLNGIESKVLEARELDRKLKTKVMNEEVMINLTDYLELWGKSSVWKERMQRLSDEQGISLAQCLSKYAEDKAMRESRYGSFEYWLDEYFAEWGPEECAMTLGKDMACDEFDFIMWVYAPVKNRDEELRINPEVARQVSERLDQPYQYVVHNYFLFMTIGIIKDRDDTRGWSLHS